VYFFTQVPLNLTSAVSSQNQFGTNETSLNCLELNQFALFEDNFMSMPTGYTERNKWKENNWKSNFEDEQICRNFHKAGKLKNHSSEADKNQDKTF
jgi:hypothetical protein